MSVIHDWQAKRGGDMSPSDFAARVQAAGDRNANAANQGTQSGQGNQSGGNQGGKKWCATIVRKCP